MNDYKNLAGRVAIAVAIVVAALLLRPPVSDVSAPVDINEDVEHLALKSTRFRSVDIDHDLSVDGTANLDDVDIDLSSEFNLDGELVCIGTTGDGSTADGDDDLIVKGDAEVDDTLDVDGNIDLDGDGFDVDITAGFSIEAMRQVTSMSLVLA